jgi:hypothetical protein
VLERTAKQGTHFLNQKNFACIARTTGDVATTAALHACTLMNKSKRAKAAFWDERRRSLAEMGERRNL